jgi:hypothetical protein
MRGTWKDAGDVRNRYEYSDSVGNVFQEWDTPDGHHSYYFDPADGGWHRYGPGTDYPDLEPMGFRSQAQDQASSFEAKDAPPPFVGDPSPFDEYSPGDLDVTAPTGYDVERPLDLASPRFDARELRHDSDLDTQGEPSEGLVDNPSHDTSETDREPPWERPAPSEVGMDEAPSPYLSPPAFDVDPAPRDGTIVNEPSYWIGTDNTQFGSSGQAEKVDVQRAVTEDSTEGMIDEQPGPRIPDLVDEAEAPTAPAPDPGPTSAERFEAEEAPPEDLGIPL